MHSGLKVGLAHNTCSKLMIGTLEQGVFIANFELTLLFVVVFLLLTLNIQLPAGMFFGLVLILHALKTGICFTVSGSFFVLFLAMLLLYT